VENGKRQVPLEAGKNDEARTSKIEFAPPEGASRESTSDCEVAEDNGNRLRSGHE
jgi:hypothetical protein